MPISIKTIVNKLELKKKQLIIAGIIVVILSIFYSAILPQIIDIDKHRAFILRVSKAKERVNGELTLGKMGLELPLTGGIVIKFKTVKLDHYNGKPIFSAKNVKCKIAILPLIFKDLVIKNIEADDFILYTTRDTKDHLTIQDAFKPPFPDDIFIIRFWGTHAKIKGYKIRLKDKVLQPIKNMFFEGKSLKLLGLTEGKDIKFKAQGLLDLSNEYDIEAYLKFPLKEDFIDNRFYLKGKISIFNLNNIQQYLPFNKTEGIITSKFDINVNNKSLYLLNKTDILEPLRIPELQLNIKNGNIAVKGELNPKKINIQKLLSNLNEIPLEIKGTITNWQTQDPEPQLNIKTSIFNIKDILSLIPILPETKDLLTKIKASQLSGQTQLDIQLKGSLKNIQAYGKLILENYSLSLSKNNNIKDITGKFNFNGYKITIQNLLIPLNKTDLVQINGEIDHNKMSFNHLNLSTNDLNLTKLKLLTLSTSDLLNYNIPLLSNIYLDGTLKSNLDFNGKIKQPNINGNVLIKAQNIQLKNINQSIKKIQGLISFEDTKLNIKNLDINISKSSKLSIKGIYSIYEAKANNIKLLSDKLNLTHVQNILISTTSLLKIPNKELKLFDITGNSKVNIELKGDINSLSPYGSVILSNVNIIDNVNKASIDNINGKITLNKNISINNITAKLLNNPLSISGIAQLNGDTDLIIKLPSFKLSDVRILAEKYKLLARKEDALIDNAQIDGSISGEISLIKKGKTISPEANLKINKSKISHGKFYDDVYFTKGDIKLTQNTMSIYDLTINMSGSTFRIDGNIDNMTKRNPSYVIKATSNDFNFALLKNIEAHESTPKELKRLLAEVESMSGKTNINLNANNKGFQVNIKLTDLSIKTTELDSPIKNIDGEVIVSNKLISLNQVSANYEDSNILINGEISNIDTTTPSINGKIKGQLSPLSFKEFYIKDIKDNLVFSQPISFRGYVKGNINNWDMLFKASVPEETTIEMKGIFKKPDNIPIKLIVNGQGSTNLINIGQITFQVGESSFNADGLIEYENQNELTINNLHLQIPNINLDEINGFLAKGLLTDNLAGNIKTDLTISGPATNPDIMGYINFIKVSLPMLKTKEISFNIDLEGQKANIKDAYANVNGVIFKLSTQIKNFKKIPIELTNLEIHSPSLSLTNLLDSISTKTQDISINYIPIMIKSGLLTIDDAILNKLITSNLKGTINLCPNGNFQINDISLNTAGGSATGNLYVNLLKSTMGAQLQVIGIKANAAASILLDLPNEIFGDLNATIIFDSHGNEYEEIIANAEGEASLIINDGKFSRLGTLEYLLKATNIINGGIAGLNINNILTTVIPMKTGSFEQLTGDFTVKQGILKTNNLISRGKNLSLEISGNYNVETDDADLNVQGNLSRNVSGLLGPLGNLNLETLTDFIPGLGFIPGLSTKKHRIGLLDFIPGLGFIPGFGGPGKKGKKVRKFAVEIQGKLYEKSSVKNFRWTK